MGRLVVIEGLDGAGKHTLTERLYAAFAARGARVTPFAFPRYDADVHAELARDALHGRLGDLAGSVHGMAVLFALDRRAAAGELRLASAVDAAALRAVWRTMGMVGHPSEIYTDPDLVARVRSVLAAGPPAPMAQPDRAELDRLLRVAV